MTDFDQFTQFCQHTNLWKNSIFWCRFEVKANGRVEKRNEAPILGHLLLCQMYKHHTISSTNKQRQYWPYICIVLTHWTNKHFSGPHPILHSIRSHPIQQIQTFQTVFLELYETAHFSQCSLTDKECTRAWPKMSLRHIEHQTNSVTYEVFRDTG